MLNSSTPYSDYIVYMPAETGRKEYIDPALIVDFSDFIDPATDSGKKIANDIQHTLSAEAGGLEAGMAEAEAGAFFHDFGDINSHCVRVFYKVFQDNGGGQSKGPGVYINRLRRFAHNSAGVGAGLFHMSYENNQWQARPHMSMTLNQKTLRIGSLTGGNGHIEYLSEQARAMLQASGQKDFKTDFNLYHSPLAVIEYGEQYKTPESRKKIASPKELADVLINTASLGEWDAGQYQKYDAYVYGNASKLLVDALKLVAASGTKLTKFEFKVLAPYMPFSLIKQMAEHCGASVVLEKSLSTAISGRHQMLDPESVKEDKIKVYATYQKLLAGNPGISFIELWGGMKPSFALQKTG